MALFPDRLKIKQTDSEPRSPEASLTEKPHANIAPPIATWTDCDRNAVFCQLMLELNKSPSTETFDEKIKELDINSIGQISSLITYGMFVSTEVDESCMNRCIELTKRLTGYLARLATNSFEIVDALSQVWPQDRTISPLFPAIFAESLSNVDHPRAVELLLSRNIPSIEEFQTANLLYPFPPILDDEYSGKAGYLFKIAINSNDFQNVVFPAMIGGVDALNLNRSFVFSTERARASQFLLKMLDINEPLLKTGKVSGERPGLLPNPVKKALYATNCIAGIGFPLMREIVIRLGNIFADSKVDDTRCRWLINCCQEMVDCFKSETVRFSFDIKKDSSKIACLFFPEDMNSQNNLLREMLDNIEKLTNFDLRNCSFEIRHAVTTLTKSLEDIFTKKEKS